jgi:pantoate--beta-alanine ligase
MDVIDQPEAMRRWTDARRHHRAVALVPTMGALHAGHVSLIELASRHADDVIVSVFVNPLQFNQAADFDSYPRPLDDDLVTCTDHHVAAVYAPTAATMYPPGFQTHVEPGSLADTMEGAARPGHFRGVATVVAKLLAACRPHVAVFGEKDYQQLVIVRRLAADLDLGVEIIAAPTVRDHDGLALSSRNARLDPDQRRAATCIPRCLAAVADALASTSQAAELVRRARRIVDAEPLATLDYLRVVDAGTLQPLVELDRPARAAIAVMVGDVRLIDNIALDPPPARGAAAHRRSAR